ncbi:MAG: site-2 protease family protein, partial [Clostridiales bacterium]|nr:site-2 protease family protein [Clostridiales bacterium]
VNREGLLNALNLMALVAINIGVFNLLPLPALDGGRLFFLLIEGIRRKPINPKYEGYVHAVGLVLLLGLMLVVTFKDIVSLIKG